MRTILSGRPGDGEMANWSQGILTVASEHPNHGSAAVVMDKQAARALRDFLNDPEGPLGDPRLKLDGEQP